MSKYIIHEIKEHLCEVCNKPLGDRVGHPYCFDDEEDTFYCPDCGLDNGYIDATEWLCCRSLGAFFEKAEYKDGVVTAYRKWGKGYRKYQIVVNEVAQNE